MFPIPGASLNGRIHCNVKCEGNCGPHRHTLVRKEILLRSKTLIFCHRKISAAAYLIDDVNPWVVRLNYFVYRRDSDEDEVAVHSKLSHGGMDLLSQWRTLTIRDKLVRSFIFKIAPKVVLSTIATGLHVPKYWYSGSVSSRLEVMRAEWGKVVNEVEFKGCVWSFGARAVPHICFWSQLIKSLVILINICNYLARCWSNPTRSPVVPFLVAMRIQVTGLLGW